MGLIHLTENDYARVHNLSATAPPTVNNDVDEGYTVGSTWVDTTNNITYICLDNTDGAAVWQQSSNAGVVGARVDAVSWADDADDFIGKNLTNSYVSQGAFVFQGADDVGSPTVIEVLANGSSSSPAHSIRIYDITNAQVIAEVTGRTSTVRSIIDMGTISNLPASPAEFQVQAKRDAGGSIALELSSCILKF